ncbi:TPA: hypothetical protein DEF17_08755, partial [bacterium]|nr:hypothetical protein [bacterium]
WLNGYPKYNSIYGLRLRKALESEANWKRLHALCGWLWIVIGIWIAAPWSDLGLILVAQVPIAFLISVVGLFFVYRRI